MSVRFETSDEDPWLMARARPLRAASRGRAAAIEQVLLPWTASDQRSRMTLRAATSATALPSRLTRSK